ncbi:MAG: protein kinase, partial [Planctomycetota bacterium]|nr:protein kinase [Planctomycetota bacterium]
MKWVTVECPGCRKPNMVDPSVTSELVCSHCDEKTLVVSTGTIGSLSGEILGENYQIEERIGQGGFGEVYRARDRLLQRLVAVKVLAQPTGPDTERSGRFLREAVTAAQITHPNVVHIYDVGSDPKRGLHYLVMEFVDGRNLKEKVEAEGPLGEGEVAAIGLQIARGLSAAHSQGIVHRDIKPGNIMEAREGGVKITDFGLARILQVDHATKTQTAGSVAYMPPEQFEGRPVDERADLYSFGATLYFLLSGKTPYPGVHDFNVMYNILSREATPLPDVAPGTSPAMWELIRDLIQKEPEKRPSGADEVIGRLESLLARDAASVRPCGSCGALNEPGVDFCSGCGKSLNARPTPPAASAPRASELDHTVKSAPVQKRKVSRHRVPLGWAGLAVGGLIILAGTIWGPSFLTSSPDPVLPEAEGPKSTAAVSTEGAELLRRGDFGSYLERGEEPLATQVGKLQ